LYGGVVVAGGYSAIHPVLAPEKGAGMPPVVYYRQSNVPDLGALAQRDGVKQSWSEQIWPPSVSRRNERR
jgi:hypothetical protein